MHILPTLFFAAILTVLGIYLAYRFIRPLLGKIRHALLPLEDQWTWTTQDGETFEDVDVDRIEAGEVFFRHKFGSAHIPIAQLSYDSRLKLERGFQTADSQSTSAVKPSTAEITKLNEQIGNRALTDKRLPPEKGYKEAA
jgi:hypothetical protein